MKKNIWVIPTNKPSKLYIIDRMLRCSSEAIKRNDKYPQNVNLYVTNYEDVVNCYALTDLNKVIKVDKDNEELWHQYNCKKR